MILEETIKKIKQKLDEEKKFLEEEITRLSKVPDMGDDVDSGEEEADESSEYGNQLALRENFKNQLADVESALSRIEKGEYGICVNCGKGIEEDILEAEPASKLCKECKVKV